MKLSIIVPTYNHEDYIKKCITSILEQKIDFEYEVLIGEDCSSDNTARILKDMEPTFPSNFSVLYREVNMGVGKNGNAWDLQRRAKGEYIITIEGDDYLLYEYKLQKQVEFLDANQEFIAIAHNCTVVDKFSNNINENYFECKQSEYAFKHFNKGILPGQLATTMYRREYNQIEDDFLDQFKLYSFFPGDRLKAFLMCSNGKIACVQEPWSAYRHVTVGGSSFSATVKVDKINELLFFKSIFNYSKSIDNKVAEKTSGKLYYARLFMRSREKDNDFTYKKFSRELFKERYWITYVGYVCFRIVYLCIAKLLKKEVI